MKIIAANTLRAAQKKCKYMESIWWIYIMYQVLGKSIVLDYKNMLKYEFFYNSLSIMKPLIEIKI